MDKKVYYEYMKNLITNKFYKTKLDVIKRLDCFYKNDLLDQAQYEELNVLLITKYGGDIGE